LTPRRSWKPSRAARSCRLGRRAKLQRIAKDDFSAQFALSLALKDVRLALQAAGEDRFAALAAWLTNGSR
jgi:3-hydroxyisobutyrate dehydrogenase-like beta-hydroxyacid dehydrogenase